MKYYSILEFYVGICFVLNCNNNLYELCCVNVIIRICYCNLWLVSLIYIYIYIYKTPPHKQDMTQV